MFTVGSASGQNFYFWFYIWSLVANTWHGGWHWHVRFPMSNSIEVLGRFEINLLNFTKFLTRAFLFQFFYIFFYPRTQSLSAPLSVRAQARRSDELGFNCFRSSIDLNWKNLEFFVSPGKKRVIAGTFLLNCMLHTKPVTQFSFNLLKKQNIFKIIIFWSGDIETSH